jgi:tRNA pseudouridine55 synthase
VTGKPEVIDGVVVVDKPPGCTSHDVVAECRRRFRQRRVGHAGTLDPDATGVLLVGLGRATRLLQFLSGLPKTYTCQIVLGVSTTTQDASGQETGRWDMSPVTVDQVRAAALQLTGSVQQVPPMVSAVKVGGRRLHELARAGVEVDRPARTVTVRRFDVVPAGEPQVFDARIECSSGTYVRTLAADLGASLGGGAHIRALRRRAIGPFVEGEAVPLADVGPDHVLTPAEGLRGLATVEAGADLARDVGHGKVLPAERLGVGGDGPWAVIGAGGDLLAVYRGHRPGTVKPVMVMGAPAGR